MLMVVVLLPLSSPMYDIEFDHGGGGGGCGGPVAAAVAAAVAAVKALAAVAAVEVVEDNLSVKAAGNESVDGRMTACNDEIGRRIITQQRQRFSAGTTNNSRHNRILQGIRRNW
jgi:hypothetical protein